MLRATLRGLMLTTGLLASAALLVGHARADAASDAAFAEVLKDPGNLDKNLAYATALVKAGDVEGAVAVLERLTLLFPDRADLHLSLGKLYQRLGSDAAAAQAFQAAIAAPITTPQIRAEAESLRGRSLARTQTSHLSGNLFAGMQYQTNANAGPDTHFVWSSGALVPRSHRDRPNDDIAGLLGFNLAHTYDFNRQDGMALESKLAGFGQFYDQENELDTGRLSGQVGLGFAPFPSTTSKFRVQPRVNFEAVTTDGQWLDGGGGPGIGATYLLSDTLSLAFDYDAIYRNYDHVGALGNTQQYTGFQQDGALTLTWVARPGTTLVASLGGRDADTEKNFLDYQGLESSIGLYQTYGSPIAALPQDWLLGLSAGYERRWYDAADPSVRPGVTRRENIWQFDAANTIPLSDSWSVVQQVEYLLDDSNLRNYSYDNFSVAMSARWRF